MKKWFHMHQTSYPIVIAENDNEIIGWASLSKYSTRCAYSKTAENSIYVKNNFQNQGIGTMLMRELIRLGSQKELHVIIARIANGNKPSVKLHEKLNFFHVGILKDVGYKFNSFIDVYLMEKIIK